MSRTLKDASIPVRSHHSKISPTARKTAIWTAHTRTESGSHQGTLEPTSSMSFCALGRFGGPGFLLQITANLYAPVPSRQRAGSLHAHRKSSTRLNDAIQLFLQRMT